VIDATWKLVAIEAFLLIVLMMWWSRGR